MFRYAYIARFIQARDIEVTIENIKQYVHAPSFVNNDVWL